MFKLVFLLQALFRDTQGQVLESEEGCLLQNQFVNEKMMTDDEDGKFATADLLQVKSYSQMLQQSLARQHEYTAHSILLRRRMAAVSSLSDSRLTEVLHQHNVYRCMHGVPALHWHGSLASIANSWAREAKGQMVHSSDAYRKNKAGFANLGENLAYGGKRWVGPGGVDAWHDEIKYTNNGTVSSFLPTYGHYTQVVWKSTTHLGCGINGKLLVCEYGPGQMAKGFETNVLPIVKTAEECGGLIPQQGLTAEKFDPEGKTMENLVNGFINSQAGSEDNCHSQILESKHQLNQLHDIVADLAKQVNSTEKQIMVVNAMLQAKLKELSDLEAWSQRELEKCRVAKEQAIQMYAKLKKELEEMHQIASPGVTMDVANGKLHKTSLIQTVVDSYGHEENMPIHHVHALHQSASHGANDDSTHISGLVSAVQKASLDLHACMSLISEQKPKSSEECENERDALQATYVKAYVELSRLANQYEELANSTACSDGIKHRYKNSKEPLEADADRLSSEVSDLVSEIEALRPRLEDATKAESKLRGQIKDLTDQCGAVAPTVSDLDKVRDAIHALSDCPGLSRVKFSLPKWTGTWVTFNQNAVASGDQDQDAAMNAACNKASTGSRAAEVDEIQEQTIEGIPTANISPNPLIGTCPNCEGTSDVSYASGHARVCWDVAQPLTLKDRSETCGNGKKAVLCVTERTIGKVPGGSL
eukprot:gnl/MRDRNA2_/MRDRNA2_102347_c0_seq1.p1 gnl/MRDRNA2_/MRDRNA2_102347_c0~~gnl/MRDRNA2_/MRDRNA2_102347_c0_seq1.p1  ORF type:complete len:704 (+),score=162.30 gnl/MRDRNA2_/MRDRNA2_102347_c0_seq1:98-2209(+)